VPLSGLSRKIAQGETLVLSFQIFFNSVTNKKRAIFLGETPPTGAQWSIFSLSGFTISHTTLFEDNEINLGTSITIADVGKLTFTTVETAAAAEGNYYGVISLTDNTDSFDVANYSFEVLDQTEVDSIPINEANIREQIGFDTTENRMNRAVTRACSRAQSWMSDIALRWIRDNGWPQKVARETEYLAGLLIRIEINDEDDDAKGELKSQEKLIRAMTFDTNKDDVIDTAGSSIQIVREGSSQVLDDDDKISAQIRQFQGSIFN